MDMKLLVAYSRINCKYGTVCMYSVLSVLCILCSLYHMCPVPCVCAAVLCVHVCVFVCDRECKNVCLTPSLTQIRGKTSLESNSKNLIKPVEALRSHSS